MTARVGWQANRLTPAQVVHALGDSIADVVIVRSPQRHEFAIAGTTESTYVGVHRSHWWLVATAV
jgi:hypothetical protein